ncbi:hypothetical protein Trydic_g10406 [Trypoxylus dichotomus]
MSCASVQVWQNDGLPAQICNKCSAKLHISFQFKKQCEKSDAKLRQYIATAEENKEQQQQEQLQQSQEQNQEQNHQQQCEPRIEHQISDSSGNCVFIECAPLIDLPHDETKFVDPFGNVTETPPLIPINYNMQAENHLSSCSLQTVRQVQVYNGTYTMPLQQMQPANIIQNQLITAPVHISSQPQIIHPTQGQTVQCQQMEDQLNTELKDRIKRNVKLKKDINDSNRQCPTCNKVFSTATKLTRHMKTHSPDMPYKYERPFRCTVCDKGCRQAQDLEKHMRTHTGERPHQCNMCTKAFSTSSNLIAHIRTHTGERPYVCCVCQKAFCQSNELTKHMRTHTGEKSHICDICQKGFNGSSTLIVHRRSHTGERPYICQVCNKGFAQSSCLAVHMKRHNGEKNFMCSVCERSFVTSSDLKEHSVTHAAAKPFGCNVCDKRYARANDLNRHAKIHIA